eukprot:TRINITY_DN7894_c0_g1_i4.p1 TRINITY_DN7894_c0_g1~~TRINITY_DN7894_c0_g1_i4.p1  ORF type:complete len:163 (-),score=29.38 TRINITY_DN7894_c0_g1_i4:306-794(-)
MMAYQKALEAAMASPSAAHPAEAYGMEDMSLSTARREVSKRLYDAKEALRTDQLDNAITACEAALGLTSEIGDKRAERSVLRTKAKALKAGARYKEAVRVLQQALEISEGLEEYSGDVDTLGSLADVYVELGDFEKARDIYDEVIVAIQNEDLSALSSTWDC